MKLTQLFASALLAVLLPALALSETAPNKPDAMQNTPPLPLQILSTLNAKPEPFSPSLADMKKAEAVLDASDCINPTRERLEALNVLKAACDRMTPETFKTFYQAGLSLSDDDLAKYYNDYPVLHFYDHAFGKVLDGVKNTVVPPGHACLWLVYNMGYVIKTDTACFAYDLHHRRAEEMVPYLDFLAVTHNHSDHFIPALANAMNRAHKAVYSNFFPNTGFNPTDDLAGYFSGTTRTLDLGNLKLTTTRTDHNARLRGFVQPVEAAMTTGKGVITVMTGSDTCNAKQLSCKSPLLDVYIVHPYVGLNVAEMTRLLHPRMVLVSHLEEFGHAIDRWRWTWRQGYDAAAKIQAEGAQAVVPVWGDKIEVRLP